ncbi:Crinkler, partial [Globisporangium splendens]
MKLFCILVGAKGSAFSVDIEESDTVGDLKDAIKKEKANDLKTVDADRLHLYLAKRDNKWLPSQDPITVTLKKGEISEGIMALMTEELDPTFSIGYLKAKSNLPDPSTQQIHVLVDLRDQRDEMASAGISVRGQDNDSTVAWLREFLQNQISSDALPLVGELADFIQEELPVKIGVHQFFLQDWSDGLVLKERQLLSRMFKLANSAPCMNLTYKVLLRVVHPVKPSGATEDSFHSFWDNLICNVLNVVLSGIGTSERRLTGCNSPDYLFVVDSVCVFRGEEEAPGACIATARRELCEKIIWRYGKVPYLFGYAAVGFRVNLYAIVRSSVSRQVDAIELGSFYLHNLGGRFRLLLALLNISRLVWSIASLCPESGQDEYKRLVQSNGVQVHLEPTCVAKIFPDAAAFQNAKWHLERVYAILQGNQVPYVDILIDTDEPTRRMVFIPRGTDTKPSSIEDLFHVLRDVLSALVKLHEAAWMHRDIRWPNVIKTRDGSGSWFLIDFVDAAPSPQDAPSGRHLSQEEHAPEIHSDDQHTTAVDMWSVGYLIETSGVRVYESWYDLYGERTEFVQQLMHDDPSQRLTAAAALEQLLQLEQQYIEQKQRESSTNDSGAPTKKLKT